MLLARKLQPTGIGNFRTIGTGSLAVVIVLASPAIYSTAMRKSLRCPKCQGQKILAVDAIQDKAPANIGNTSLSIDSKAPWTTLGSFKNMGQFTCCICATCEYVEWYVAGAASLPIDGKTVRLLSD